MDNRSRTRKSQEPRSATGPASAPVSATNGEPIAPDVDQDVKPDSANGDGSVAGPSTNALNVPPGHKPNGTSIPHQPADLVDDIMNVLKTSSPLLALTMEKLCDQIAVRAKPSSDEDIYRFFAALLNDAMQVRFTICAQV